jgi:hypothetical protein
MRLTITPVLCLVLGLVGLTGKAAAAPVLVIDQAEFDFGFAPQNSRISHTFHLQNAGRDTLIISKVIPGCGCTKVPLKKSTLAPGEETEVEIIFSTGQYNGPVTKHPRLETNATPVSQSLMFRATVTNRPDSTFPILVKPYKLDISQFGQTERNQMGFTITNISDQQVSLILVSGASELFSATLPEKISAGKMGEGTVKLTDAALEQSFESSFTLQLSDSSLTRFTVPVKRTVQGPSADASTPTEATLK